MTAGIALRLLQYACLLPLAGILLDPVRTGIRDGALNAVLRALALLAPVACAAAFASVLLDMTGATLTTIDSEMTRYVVLETDPGRAFVVRLLALVVTAALIVRGKLRLAAGFAVVSLVTLVWSGHAAATEGIGGTVHRISDVLHLLAAAAWIGAIVTLLFLNGRGEAKRASVPQRVAWLRSFSITGMALVATVIVSGAINLMMIAGPDGVRTLPSTPYGWLLGLKLVAFLGMLIIAAVNRWSLTQRLEQAEDSVQAERALCASLAVELSLAVAILALVAMLGSLDPFDASRNILSQDSSAQLKYG